LRTCFAITYECGFSFAFIVAFQSRKSNGQIEKNVRRNGIVKRKKERVKKMQDEQKKFQEKLSELLSYARNHENKVTMKEVRDFFEDFALDEQKVTFVCEYLTMEQVDVADYEPGVVPEETEKEKKKPEFSEEELRALQQYLDELPETETPSEEETAELYRKAAEGDSLAKSMLVQLWLPKVIETAKEMHTRDFFLMDLVQEGNVGLLVALESVVKAETAEQAIDAAVRETISDFMEEHRVQKHKDNTVVNKVNRLKDAIEELSDGDDMDFSVAELSAYLDMSVEEIEDILRIAGEEP
jgi:RNA polymerase primary sigma factor